MNRCDCQDPVVYGCHCPGRPAPKKNQNRIARECWARLRCDIISDILTITIGRHSLRMDREMFETLPVGTELTCDAQCPSCCWRAVELKVVLQAEPVGEWSLAGSRMKVPARRAVRYTCTRCGTTGLAEPK